MRLVLTDLDDTLVPLGSPCVPERARKAWRAAQAAGICVGPVTGRLPSDMTWLFGDDVELCATGAFANGQIVMVDGRVVFDVAIPTHTIERLQEAADATQGKAYLALYDPWDVCATAYITRDASVLASCPPPTYGEITRVLSQVADFAPTASNPAHGYVKANIQCACPVEELDALRCELEAAVPEVDLVFPGNNIPVIDVVPQHWDKGQAACKLAKELNIAIDDVLVFGDSDNDISLFKAIPASVAVAGASPGVAALARWQIGTCADGAVADALFELAQSAREGTCPSFMGGAQ